MAIITDPLVDQSFSYVHEVRSDSSTEAAHSTSAGMEMVWPNWPPNVPEPELLRHL